MSSTSCHYAGILPAFTTSHTIIFAEENSMSIKPLIGCTTYRKTSEQSPPIDLFGLMPSYIDAITAVGGLPVMIPLGLTERDLSAILNRIDGLLLPGGGDIEPQYYGGHMLETMYGFDEDRDRVELYMARQAVTQRKPLLTICRGTQVLNVALGGTLWEDVKMMMPQAITHDYNRIQPRNFLAHSVDLHPDSLLHRQIGRAQTRVNSLHHQGINRLAAELHAVALAPDGLIEGVEVPGHPYAVGVQWHPENLIADDPAMLTLFAGLVNAAAGSASALTNGNGAGREHTPVMSSG